MRDFLSNPHDQNRNPQTAAQQAMRPVLPKRFYEKVSIGEDPDASGFTILLDGRKVKTPARRTLVLPNEKSAEIVAHEWRDQKEHIDPAIMPATRMVNTACDGIADDPQSVIEDMLKFSKSDLLCYRASEPEALVELQRQYWDGVLDWAATKLDAHFETTESLVQIPQPKSAVAAISHTLKQWPHPIQIATLHTFTNLTGSVILALAIASKHMDPATAWKCANVDEDWNTSKWGEDYEAKKRLDFRWLEIEAAHSLFFAVSE